jgi:hypothetical protein
MRVALTVLAWLSARRLPPFSLDALTGADLSSGVPHMPQKR